MGAYGDKYDLMIDRNIRKAMELGFTRELATHPEVALAKNVDEFGSGVLEVINIWHMEGVTDEPVPQMNGDIYMSRYVMDRRKKEMEEGERLYLN